MPKNLSFLMVEADLMEDFYLQTVAHYKSKTLLTILLSQHFAANLVLIFSYYPSLQLKPKLLKKSGNENSGTEDCVCYHFACLFSPHL